MKQHHYKTTVTWTGNKGEGTAGYRTYERAHLISAPDKKSEILGSSDPSFRGDKQRYNPEELFVASLSSCHMLWYLHLCAVNQIIVTKYNDNAQGIMEEDEQGSGKFKSVTLCPEVTITNPDKMDLALKLHSEANAMCFIAKSCNFSVGHQPTIKVEKNN